MASPILITVCLCLAGAPGEEGRTDFFEKQIRPLLHARCVKCHGPKEQKGTLRLDTAAGLTEGGESGAVVVPGDPDTSLLIDAIRRTGDLKMPPEQALATSEVDALVEWVKSGAVWPGYGAPRPPPASRFTAEQKAFWAFQPVVDPPLPAVEDTAWPATPLDFFIRATLEKHRLEPAPDVDKRTWLRRVHYDLVGLPPAPDAIDAFLADASPSAYEKVVDRLLASPHYGERWGRHWLDLVRYSDTTGQEADWIMFHAWRYRDYVINAFNSDKAYDRFITEQLAGDLLPPTGDFDTTAEQVVATGFLMLSPKATAEADKELMVLDIVDEQIDIMGRAFLGLTVACARCHDHKFDPIPTLDYYSIAGIFRSTQTMVDHDPTSMWSEYRLGYIPSAAEKKQIAADAGRITALETELAAREQAAAADQVEWEERLLRDAVETGGASGALAKIARTPFAERTAAEQVALGAAVAAADRAIDGSGLTPDALPGLHAWYKADSITPREDGTTVTAWIDSSSNPRGLNLLTEAGYAPSYRTAGFHGKPAVHFGYMSDLMRTAGELGLTGEQHYTGIFALHVTRSSFEQDLQHHTFRWGILDEEAGGVLMKINSSTSEYERFDLATGHGNDALSGEVTIGKPQIWSVRYGGGPVATHVVKIDGKAQPITPSGKAVDLALKLRDAELFIGGDTGAEMNVAEVIFFNRKLSEDEEETVGYYLQQKYGLETQYEALPITRLVARPAAERTSAEQQTLRHYYLVNRDPVYRDLSAELTIVRSRKGDVESSRPPLVIMAVRDEKEPKDIHVYHRGNYNQPGERAPRRFLQIIAGEGHAPITTADSGRLALARWITTAQHPLTARVRVNHIWQGHFGAGLVRSSDNFGVLGDKPSHPKLLDWLAARFVENGWSSKPLHRLIVLSRVYRQASTTGTEGERIDPENLLLGRMPRRRLEAEAFRDGLLAASGSLVPTVGGRITDWWKEAQEPVDPRRGLIALSKPAADLKAYDSGRRSVYLPVLRNQLFELFTLFDYTDASSLLARRGETTVAPQALFLMNSRHVRVPALQLARLLLARDASDAERVQIAHRRTFGRAAMETEVHEALEYLAAHAEAKAQSGADRRQARLEAWQSYAQLLFCQNEFVYID